MDHRTCPRCKADKHPLKRCSRCGFAYLQQSPGCFGIAKDGRHTVKGTDALRFAFSGGGFERNRRKH